MDLHNEVSKIKEFNKEEGKSWGGDGWGGSRNFGVVEAVC